jgi:hypothetical protein
MFICYWIGCVESERKKEYSEGKGKNVRSGKSSTAAASFGFRELALATRGFNEANLIGEGGFGKVFKGRLSTNEVILNLKLLIFRVLFI